MVEIVGDDVFPKNLSLPILTTTEANAISGHNMLSGLLIWNSTLGVIDVWDGQQWESVTSTGRA